MCMSLMPLSMCSGCGMHRCLCSHAPTVELHLACTIGGQCKGPFAALKSMQGAMEPRAQAQLSHFAILIVLNAAGAVCFKRQKH